MGIAILTLDHLMARLGGAVEALLSRGARLSPAKLTRPAASATESGVRPRAAAPAITPQPHADGSVGAGSSASAAFTEAHDAAQRRQAITGRAGRPVRIVHIADARSGRRAPGRLVISGRMADVCAELNRLAAQEALAH